MADDARCLKATWAFGFRMKVEFRLFEQLVICRPVVDRAVPDTISISLCQVSLSRLAFAEQVYNMDRAV